MGPMESSDSEESSSEEDEKDKDSQDYADGLHVESKGIECEYQDWQMETPVACNCVHEVDIRFSYLDVVETVVHSRSQIMMSTFQSF